MVDGGPGVDVVLCRDTKVCGSWKLACDGLLLNVATGPAVPRNDPVLVVAVTLLPKVSDPAPNGEFSIGAAGRLPALSATDML